MQALVLAGGLGTRLRPVVSNRPKPMAPIENKPFLEYQIEFLRKYGVVDVVLCVGYLHEQIEGYFGDGEQWGVCIRYSVEEALMGTAGALKHAEHFVQDTFFVLNGDSYFDIPLDEMAEWHWHKKRANGDRYVGTVALTGVSDPARYGSVELDAENNIASFQEKAHAQAHVSGQIALINAGIYILEPAILRLIPAQRVVSLERETFPAVLAHGALLGGYAAKGYFIDIGSPAGYSQVQHDFRERLA